MVTAKKIAYVVSTFVISFSVGTAISAPSCGTASSVDDGGMDENPHEGIEVITPWDHKNVERLNTPAALVHAQEAMNGSGSYGADIDRPHTSFSIPVAIDARNPDNAFGILEVAQVEWNPTSTPRSNGDRGRFTLNLNFDDVNQWRALRPALYAASIDDGGYVDGLTSSRHKAPLFCNDASPLTSSDQCDEPQPFKVRPETYINLFSLLDDGLIRFADDFSQLNGARIGNSYSTGQNIFSIVESSKDHIKPTVRFLQTQGLIDIDERYIHETDGGQYITIRVMSSSGYSSTKYIPILEEGELL